MEPKLKAHVLLNTELDNPRIIVVLAESLESALQLLWEEEDDDDVEFGDWSLRFKVINRDVDLVRGVLVNSELSS